MKMYSTSLIAIPLTLASLVFTSGETFSSAKASSKVFTWTQSKKDTFAQPESVYWYQDTNTYFVSNIAGDGQKKDKTGWISKLDQDGNVVAAKWVTGLNAPKGMRAHDGYLYVSDIDQVTKINIAGGKVVENFKVANAIFLNDVDVDNQGNIFVSDTLASKIYKISQKGKVSVFVEGDDWESPNGLLIHGDELVVGAWGLTKDWSNKTAGHLYKINLSNKKRTNISQKAVGNLDGLEVDPKNADRYVVSDWVSGKIFEINDGVVKELQSLSQGSADIALRQKKSGELEVVVPMMKDAKVHGLKW